MDFENMLHTWKAYQIYKLKMANTYPCVLSFSYNRSMLDGRLSFVGTQQERRMEIRDESNDMVRSIPLQEILGSSPEGSTIRFTLHGGGILIMEFPTPRIQELVHQQWVIFEREEHGPTPPSSSDGD